VIRFAIRFLRYLGAFLNGKLDEVMDPRVLIEQAIVEARRQHALLCEQAAAVIGNQRELEIKMARSNEEIGRLRARTEQALLLADRARKADEPAKADSHEETARVFASHLISLESGLRNLTDLHAKSLAGSATARRAVEQNANVLRTQLAQRTRLLNELDAAKLAERMNEAIAQISAMSFGGELPTLTDVRDRIDERMARATGRAELGAGSVDARMLDVERSVIDREGEERLAEIRKSLGFAERSATT
jgi:phage shock protein A